MKNTSKYYFEKRKVVAFHSDLATRTLLITKLWELNDNLFTNWSELKMLLDINELNENIKLKKGLLKVASNLKEISEYISKSVEKPTVIEEPKEQHILGVINQPN